ncbi:MAG: zinc-dependent metalloprotease [Longimicrobiales bacterium]
MKRFLALVTAASLTAGLQACSSGQAQPATPSPSTGSGGAQTGPRAGGGGDGEGPKPYAEVVTEDAVSDEGVFTVHRVDEDLLYEIPMDMLGVEMLQVTRIARTHRDIGYGGQKANTQTVVWERRGDKVDLRVTSWVNVADTTLPIAEAVENSNLPPIIATFDVAAYNADSTAVVIDVSDLYTTDIPMLGLQRNRRQAYGVRRLDSDRSYVASANSYPRNLEVRHVLTYDATEVPANESTGSITLEMAHSMIKLPDEPMQPRLWDDRVGFFSLTQNDYGLDVQRAETRRYITRYRLEPSDPAAYARGEVVDPVEPIVYYIDRATPEWLRPYLAQGVEDWQPAFEQAGFSNAIVARMAPTPEEDPEYSPEDIRYSVIRYFASPIRNASGPHVHDPRTGEILESDINWYHNALGLVRNWYFVHTAAANPAARGLEFEDDVMGQLIRFVSAHEVGHTIGLQHAHQSSAAYTVDDLRSREVTCNRGTSPSIMDYARFNYVAQPGDDVCFMPMVGPYDKWAVEWGYRVVPGQDTDEERDELHQWVLDHAEPLYRYGTNTDYDPTSPSEGLTNDPVAASDLGIENLKVIRENLMDWTTEAGEDYEQMEELYGSMLGQWNNYMRHVATIIGGVERTAKMADQEGPVYELVPEARQRGAMDFLARQAFTTPEWMIDEEIFTRIEPAGMMERIRQAQVGTVERVLDMGRMQRLIESEARIGDAAYTLGEMMAELRQAVWSELGSGQNIDAFRRNLQRGYLERMEFLMENEQPEIPAQFRQFVQRTEVDVSQSDIPAFVRGELGVLRGQVTRALNQPHDTATTYHLRDVVARIDAILDTEE